MTNDRTAAAIRRHFLQTADERPEDGQLEASLDLTSTTRQRPRWVIAARELPYPSAALPSTALRFALLAALLVIAAAGFAVLGGGSGGARTVFEGTWTSIDPPDGSKQTLIVGPGSNPAVEFEDAFSIMCSRGGDASTLYVGEGPGDITFDRLTVHFAESGCITWRVAPFDGIFDHDAETDTLLDHWGITWHRQP